MLARVGASSLAAHQIAFQLFVFLALVLDALAIAAQVLVGRMLGAGDPVRARAAARRVILWSAVVGAGFAAVLLALADVIPHAFTGDDAVVERAHQIWWLFALLMPLNAVVFALDGILIGAGDTRFLMWGMLAAAALYVPVALLSLAPGLGHRGGLVGARGADRGARPDVRWTLPERAVGSHRGSGVVPCAPACSDARSSPPWSSRCSCPPPPAPSRAGATTSRAGDSRAEAVRRSCREEMQQQLPAAAATAGRRQPDRPVQPAPGAGADRGADRRAAADDPLSDDLGGTTTLYVIMGALLLVFIGVGLFISRDARRSMPKQTAAERNRQRDQGPHKHQRRAKEKARERSKRQRAARRRNRA